MPRDGEKRPKKKGSEASSKPDSERNAIKHGSTRGSEASRRTSGEKGHAAAAPQSLDPYSLVEAVEIVKHCLDMEKEVPFSLPDNIWDEAINLEPVLAFVAEPSFVPPSSFSEAMDTCVACLLMAEDGKLLQPALMLSMLEESSTKRVIKYLQWLEPAMNKVAASGGNVEWSSSRRQPVKVQVVKNALDQWPSECARLRDSAGALWEAMLTKGAETIQQLSEWQKCNQLRSVIQAQQEDECARIADEIEGTSTKVVADIRGEVDQEWPKIAKTTENALKTVQRISSGLLTTQQDKMVSCMTEYEELDRHQKNCKSSILEARRQVRRRQQALAHSEQRFTQLANQLVAWISWLASKLVSLLENKQSLRVLLDLHQQIPKLEQEQADVEDELDSVTMDLRRHRRQYGEDGKSRSLLGRGSSGSGNSGNMSEKQLAAITKQYEQRESMAKRRLSELSDELAQVSREHEKVAKALPFEVVPEEVIPVRSAVKSSRRSDGEEQLPPMPMQESSMDDLATLLTDVTTIHVAENCPIETADRYAILDKVDQRRRNAAKAMGVNAGYCCPLTMQIFKEPVVASDGHTYERKAIEAWLRVQSTSPLTGTLLMNRHLVENLNLRTIMESMGLISPVEKTTSRRTSSSKKKKKAPKVTNEEDAAVLIQRKFRQSIVAKKQNSDKKKEKKIKRSSEGKRSSKSSRSSRRSNDEERKVAAAKEAAAVRIQAIMRGRQARSIVAVRKEEAEKLRKARIEHEKKEAAEAARKAAASAAADEDSESYYESSESEYETDSEDEPPKKK